MWQQSKNLKWTDINILKPSLSVTKMIQVSCFIIKFIKKKGFTLYTKRFPSKSCKVEKGKGQILGSEGGAEERALASQPSPYQEAPVGLPRDYK